MRKHAEVHHAPEEQVTWIMTPVVYFRTNLRRQIVEAVRITRRGEREQYCTTGAASKG